MTIIVAISDGKRVFLGSNTGALAGNQMIYKSGDDKFLYFGDWALGVTGPSIAYDILKYKFSKSKKVYRDVMDVVFAIREFFVKMDIQHKDDDDAFWNYEAAFILAKKSGKIWDIDRCLSPAAIPSGQLWARGSGREFAVGADHAILATDPQMNIEKRVRLCVEAACSNDQSCPGEIEVRHFS